MSSDKVQLFMYFSILSITGSLLLMLPFMYRSGYSVSFIDALFTSVSAVCVTGLSTISMNEFSLFGFITIMVLIEFGGLGILTFITLFVTGPQRKVSLVTRTMIREFFVDEVEYEPRKILRSIMIFTLGIESVGAIIMYFGFLSGGSARPVFDAIFHSVSAFCNAGFSTYADSLAPFRSNTLVIGPVAFLIVCGGVGFIVLKDIIKIPQKPRMAQPLSFHSRFVLVSTFILIIFGTVFFFLAEYRYSLYSYSLTDKIQFSLFQAITPRTAGFSLIDQALLSPISKFFTFLLMFIGGSPGSIAGGVKTTTFFIVLLYAIRGNYERNGLNVFNRNISTANVEKAFSIVAKSLLMIIGAIMLLLFFERNALSSGLFSYFDLFFEVVSAFATVGLSQGLTGILSSPSKVVIIFTMFIGRTGVLAMALGFAQKHSDRFSTYPSASIMIG